MKIARRQLSLKTSELQSDYTHVGNQKEVEQARHWAYYTLRNLNVSTITITTSSLQLTLRH